MKSTYTRGSRRSAANIPPNMRERMAADEARAWAHSELAGQLWESGLRLKIAIREAEKIRSHQKIIVARKQSPCFSSPVATLGGTGPADPGTPLESEIMKSATIATLASQMSAALNQTPRLTKNEAHDLFRRIAETARTRKQAAQALAESFFDLNPEDEMDARRIERAISAI